MREDKHHTEILVLEAMDADGCPICRLNRRAIEGWTDSLLAEGITDTKARLGLRAARGLCAEHGGLLEERGSPLPVAILLHDLLTEAAPASETREPDCPACAFLKDTETRYVAALARLLERTDARNRFEACSGLCAPHTRRLLRAARRSQHAFLRAAAARHTASLVADLAEIIRKHDYRYATETPGPEANAWRRAVSLWNGECVARF